MALFNFRPVTPQEKEQKALAEARLRYQAMLGQAPQMESQLMQGPLMQAEAAGPSRPGYGPPMMNPMGLFAPEQRPMLEDVVTQGSGLLGSLPPTPKGQVSPQEMLLRTAGMPGNIGPNVMQALSSPKDKQTTLVRNLKAAGVDLSSPEGQQTMLGILKRPATQINLGQGKPLGAGAANWVNSKAENPLPTMDVYEATKAGFKPLSSAQIQSMQSAGTAAPVIGQIISWGIGEKQKDSIFPSGEESTASRAVGGASAYIKSLTRSDEKLFLYNSNKKAMLSKVARLVGHTGVLTLKDIGLVEDLFPIPGLTPRPLAKKQFRSMVSLLKGLGVAEQKLKEAGFPAWTFDSVQEKKPWEKY